MPESRGSATHELTVADACFKLVHGRSAGRLSSCGPTSGEDTSAKSAMLSTNAELVERKFSCTVL
jgi:hypothetical protein